MTTFEGWPDLTAPVLIAAFEGWNDAGDAATGVVEHLDRIDEVLSTYSKGWTLARMPAVDRNVLRIGVYELLWGDDDVPDTVAVSEALHLVQDLSTDDSPAFVNGEPEESNKRLDREDN